MPRDILPALPPQGHSWAASRTNIPIIDKAGSSQRQVLTFSLLLQLFQCLFRGFQAVNIIASASPSVHRSRCSLSSRHCRLLVKWETSEWHLCKRRAGMETWGVCGALRVHGRAWVVTPKPATRWTKVGLQSWWLRRAAKGLALHPHSAVEGHPCITHLCSATDDLEYHGCITCTHETAIGSVSSTLAMNVSSYPVLS